MKKRYLLVLSVLSILALAGCSPSNSSSTYNPSDYGSDYTYTDPITVDDPTDVEVEENTGDFSIETSDGEYSKSGNVYMLIVLSSFTNISEALTGNY